MGQLLVAALSLSSLLHMLVLTLSVAMQGFHIRVGRVLGHDAAPDQSPALHGNTR